MTEQKALLLKSRQGPLVLGTRPIPTPKPGELLIKIHATALNPVDWKIQAHGIIHDKFPAVLGMDGAGEVEAFALDVEGWSKGDQVFFQGKFDSDYATFQQYAVVPAEIVAKIPENISFAQAATIPGAFVPPVLGLWSEKPTGVGLQPSLDGIPRYAGQPVLVIGGSSSTGQYAIQLLKLSGFSPIIAYVSSSHFDYLKSLGATHFIDRRATSLEDLPVAVREIAQAPLKLVFDGVASSEAQQAGYDTLAPGGQLVTVLEDSIKNKTEPDDKEVLWAKGNFHYFDRSFGKVVWAHMTHLLESGALVPNRLEVLPNGLEGIPSGFVGWKVLEKSAFLKTLCTTCEGE